MATYKSSQYTNATSSPVVNNPAYDTNGDLFGTWFDYAFTGVETTGDIIVLAVIPKDIRIQIGDLQSTACGTGVTATLSLQTAAVTLSSALAISSISQATFAQTIALGFGTVVKSSSTIAVPPVPTGPDADFLIATIGGGTANNTGIIRGFLKYTSIA